MRKSNRIKNRIILRKITIDNAEELGLNYTGEGSYGICYLDEETGVIYKLFKITPTSFSTISPFSLVKLKKLNHYRIAFPQNLIIRNFRIKGISYDYIEGETLESFIDNKKELTAADFIRYYNDLMAVIPYLEENNVRIDDLNCGNIIINQYGFHIIDTDKWLISKHFDYTQSNINEINQAMWDLISNCCFIFDDQNNIIIDDEEFQSIISETICQLPTTYNLATFITDVQNLINRATSYDELLSSLQEYSDNINKNEKKRK